MNMLIASVKSFYSYDQRGENKEKNFTCAKEGLTKNDSLNCCIDNHSYLNQVNCQLKFFSLNCLFHFVPLLTELCSCKKLNVSKKGTNKFPMYLTDFQCNELWTTSNETSKLSKTII